MKAFLWINGWSCEKIIWKDQILRWPQFDHYVLDLAKCTSKKQIIDSLQNLINSLNYDKIYIIGWSLGAMLALDALTDKKVTQLFCISPVISFVKSPQNPWGWNKSTLEHMKKMICKDKQRVLCNFDKKLFKQTESFYYTKWEKEVRIHISPNKLLCSGLDYLLDYNITPKLHEIKNKVCILASSDDLICNIENTKQLNAKLLNSTLTIWHNTGHASFWIHSEKFNHWMKDNLIC